MADNGLWTKSCRSKSEGSVAMPRYFFHLSSGSESALDSKGVELDNLAAAYLHARQMLHRIRVNFPEAGDDWFIAISDQLGRKPLVVLPTSTPRFGRRSVRSG